MVDSPLTFFEEPKGLSVGKDALDVDADGSLVRVLAAHHGESQALVARALHEDDILDAVHLALSLARQRAELGFITSLEKNSKVKQQCLRNRGLVLTCPLKLRHGGTDPNPDPIISKQK